MAFINRVLKPMTLFLLGGIAISSLLFIVDSIFVYFYASGNTELGLNSKYYVYSFILGGITISIFNINMIKNYIGRYVYILILLPLLTMLLFAIIGYIFGPAISGLIFKGELKEIQIHVVRTNYIYRYTVYGFIIGLIISIISSFLLSRKNRSKP